MPQYTIPQCPELLLKVPGVDSDNARYKATRQIVSLINEGHLNIRLPECFCTKQLIEVTKQDLMAEDEQKIIEAVKVISKLSAAKQTSQELYQQALQTRQMIEVLFNNQTLTKKEFNDIEDSLKIIKNYAIANLRYKEALSKAEEARSILDEALNLPKQ